MRILGLEGGKVEILLCKILRKSAEISQPFTKSASSREITRSFADFFCEWRISDLIDWLIDVRLISQIVVQPWKENRLEKDNEKNRFIRLRMKECRKLHEFSVVDFRYQRLMFSARQDLHRLSAFVTHQLLILSLRKRALLSQNIVFLQDPKIVICFYDKHLNRNRSFDTIAIDFHECLLFWKKCS